MSLGSDISGVEDLDPNLTFLEGEEEEKLAFTQAIARRFVTPQGGLWYKPTYGLDLRSFLADTIRPEIVEAAISAQARLDERCVNCSATITVQEDGNWKVDIFPVTEDGQEYQFTFLVTTEKVSLLTGLT